MGGGAGVKNLWRKSLGEFRKEELTKINSLPDKRVVIDTSAWVHKFDGVHEVAYARTSNPRYPHHAIRHSFSAKVRVLKMLGIKPIFVFDGKVPNMKKRESKRRKKNSVAARDVYHERLDAWKATGQAMTEETYSELLRLRRKSALPIVEDYASLRQWMEDSGIEYVQAPFEADAQMKQLITEGRASGAITEDGDLVVLEVPHILSSTKLDTSDPKKSTCQYFELGALKQGKYASAIAEGDRSNYLPEISCFLGNDYIDNIPNVGSATLFGTGGRSNQKAIIDDYINRTIPEREWLKKYQSEKQKEKDCNWTPDDSFL